MDKHILNSKTLVSNNEVPIVDLARTDTDSVPSKAWIKEIASELSEAFTKHGIVFLINHGISEKKVQDVYKVMGTFFALPDEVKESYKLNPPEQVQGYASFDMETLYSKDKKEIKHSYNYMDLPEKLPTKEIPNFRQVVGDVVEDFLNLTKMLLEVFADALEIDPEHFLSCHQGMFKKNNLTAFRMLHYPPIGDVPFTDVTRCGEHSDWGTFTLLTQDSEGGLEVFIYGEWQRVGYLPGAIIMNLGDMMEEWSSTKFESVRHRVVIPEDISTRSKGRCSTAFFVLPDNDTLIDRYFFRQCKISKPEDDAIIEGNNKPTTSLEYMEQKLRQAFDKPKISNI